MPAFSTRRIILGAILLVVAGLAVVAAVQATRSRPRFIRQVAWAGTGVWLKAETHTQTGFSDGAHSIDEIADHAVANGCDALAITDHSDGDLKAATPEYHAAIAATRTRVQPQGLMLIAGFEWNPPPGKGQDHAAVLLPDAWDTATLTATFKERFDDLNKEGENPELATAAFAWLKANNPAGSPLPVIFLNHPGRRAADVNDVFQRLSFLLKQGPGIVVGAEGAPGHQHATPLGAYGSAIKPEDRWDPSVVGLGAVWDRLLEGGTDAWAALATSDFHSDENGDYWPCQFSYTAIYAPERSTAGVLRALRAGTFVGVHGGIVRSADLRVSAPGLPRAAIAGEAIAVPSGSRLSVDLVLDVPAKDWSGADNHIDALDLIGVTPDAARIVGTGAPDPTGRWHTELDVPATGIVLRARGRRVIEDGPDLMFYTNPVRIAVR